MSHPPPNEEHTLGVLLPDELVNECGLKEGDVFEVVETQDGISLRPQKAELATQLKAARIGMRKYSVALRDLAK